MYNSIRTSSQNEETRDVVEYVMNVLLDGAFKEHIRRKTNCALDFLTDKARRKLTSNKCPTEQVMIPLDDFIPPKLQRRFKPQIEFQKPYPPCSGPCAKLNKGSDEKKWQKHCSQMAEAMSALHDGLPYYFKADSDVSSEEMGWVDDVIEISV
jgi:hypothetical protein